MPQELLYFVVGKLRFTMPKEPSAWSDPLNCTTLPNKCPQFHVDHKIYSGNEDCLFLDIYRPSSATEGSELPVMVRSSNQPRPSLFISTLSSSA